MSKRVVRVRHDVPESGRAAQPRRERLVDHACVPEAVKRVGVAGRRAELEVQARGRWPSRSSLVWPATGAGSRHRTHRSRDGSHRASREGAQPRGQMPIDGHHAAPRGCRDRAGLTGRAPSAPDRNRRARSVSTSHQNDTASSQKRGNAARVGFRTADVHRRRHGIEAEAPARVRSMRSTRSLPTASTETAGGRSGSNFVDPMYPKSSRRGLCVAARAEPNRTSRLRPDEVSAACVAAAIASTGFHEAS